MGTFMKIPVIKVLIELLSQVQNLNSIFQLITNYFCWAVNFRFQFQLDASVLFFHFTESETLSRSFSKWGQMLIASAHLKGCKCSLNISLANEHTLIKLLIEAKLLLHVTLSLQVYSRRLFLNFCSVHKDILVKKLNSTHLKTHTTIL